MLNATCCFPVFILFFIYISTLHHEKSYYLSYNVFPFALLQTTVQKIARLLFMQMTLSSPLMITFY